MVYHNMKCWDCEKGFVLGCGTLFCVGVEYGLDVIQSSLIALYIGIRNEVL